MKRRLNAILATMVFYGAILPVGLLMRIFRTDPLTRELVPGDRTYWRAASITRRSGLISGLRSQRRT